MLFLKDTVDEVDEEIRMPDNHVVTTSQNNQATFLSNQRHTTRSNAPSSATISEEDLDQFLGFDYDDIIVGRQGNPGDVAYESVLTESQQTGQLGTISSRTEPPHKGRKRKVRFNAENKLSDSTNSTVPVDAFLKLEQLNHNINTLLKLNSVSKEPNYSFVISQLEMLRCIKNENDLADLKAKIYKLIADTIATQQ